MWYLLEKMKPGEAWRDRGIPGGQLSEIKPDATRARSVPVGMAIQGVGYWQAKGNGERGADGRNPVHVLLKRKGGQKKTIAR